LREINKHKSNFVALRQPCEAVPENFGFACAGLASPWLRAPPTGARRRSVISHYANRAPGEAVAFRIRISPAAKDCAPY
jgi:hypothetical protein